MTPSVARDVKVIGSMPAVSTILEVVSRTTGLRFAAVARVTDTTWTACAVYDQIDFGLVPGGELELRSTICDEIRDHGQPVVIRQASADPIYANHHTPRIYGIEGYISVPIFRANGLFFGTLCAIDPLPAPLDDPNILRTLELFAQLISAQLETAERLEQSNQALVVAHDTATLREQFLAVVGHDLRSPLQAIQLGTELLHGTPLNDRAKRTLELIRRSGERMAGLIDNVLDFARGRLGGGIPVALGACEDIAGELQHVCAEVRMAHPEHAIHIDIDIRQPVICDRPRIAQLLANLLTNAVIHGGAEQPISVVAHSDSDIFQLSVANGGEPIPAASMTRLFQPFSREQADTPRPGLGLGLYIAAEIARAHGGTLEVTSNAADGTRFVFRMPVAPTG